jgi:phosphotriesterase-related protein
MSHDMANDITRINEIMELIEDGFLDHILISHDMAFKTMLRSFGGGGYSYILKIIVPMMRRKGMTAKQIHTILVENPKRAITIA